MCPFEFESSNGKWRILRLCGTITFRLSVELGLYIGEDIYIGKKGGLWCAKTAGGESAPAKEKAEKKKSRSSDFRRETLNIQGGILNNRPHLQEFTDSNGEIFRILLNPLLAVGVGSTPLNKTHEKWLLMEFIRRH